MNRLYTLRTLAPKTTQYWVEQKDLLVKVFFGFPFLPLKNIHIEYMHAHTLSKCFCDSNGLWSQGTIFLYTEISLNHSFWDSTSGEIRKH